MFKLKKTQYVTRSIRLNEDLAETLEKLGDTNGLSFTAVVAQCCEYAIAHMNENDVKKDK